MVVVGRAPLGFKLQKVGPTRVPEDQVGNPVPHPHAMKLFQIPGEPFPLIGDMGEHDAGNENVF